MNRRYDHERLFGRLATNRGWDVFRLTRRGSMDRHFRIQHDDESYNVEVKCVSDIITNDGWIPIELHIDRTDIDIIVFEHNYTFILIDKDSLMGLIDMDAVVMRLNDAKYKVYKRRGRREAITLIELEKLREIAWDIWE